MKKKLLPDGFPDTPLQRHLAKLGACHRAWRWADKRTPKQAWDECPERGWLEWWCYAVNDEKMRIGQSYNRIDLVSERAYEAAKDFPLFSERISTRLEILPQASEMPLLFKIPG